MLLAESGKSRRFGGSVPKGRVKRGAQWAKWMRQSRLPSDRLTVGLMAALRSEDSGGEGEAPGGKGRTPDAGWSAAGRSPWTEDDWPTTSHDPFATAPETGVESEASIAMYVTSGKADQA
jgi:hypothetical protein